MNWKWRVSHARGYRELGLLKEAQRELECISDVHASESEVLIEQAALGQESGAWEKLANACRALVQRHPEDVGWWIMWAYGARRSTSLTDAEKILLEAEVLHASDATIQFNLGCYACQLGNLAAAYVRVQKAIALDPQYRSLAKSDADLEPLRRTMPDYWPEE
jgi:tetratricopeptide (TPR) repeat protein